MVRVKAIRYCAPSRPAPRAQVRPQSLDMDPGFECFRAGRALSQATSSLG
jgi:hypothetical protein